MAEDDGVHAAPRAQRAQRLPGKTVRCCCRTVPRRTRARIERFTAPLSSLLKLKGIAWPDGADAPARGRGGR